MATNSQIAGTRKDRTVKDLDADPITGALHIVDTQHYRVHSGDAFNYSAKTTVASGSSIYFLGKVATKAIHLRNFNISATNGPIDVELYESPTITDNGTLATVRNRNRESSTINTLSVYISPTVTDDGDQVFILGVVASAAITPNPEEWRLAPNTDYTMKLTNNGVGTATIYATFFWYEEN